MSVAFTCGLHGWMANGVPCPTCEKQRYGYRSPLPHGTMLLDRAVEIRLSVLEAKVAKLERAASAMSASGQDPEEGLEAKPASATRAAGNAQRPPQ